MRFRGTNLDTPIRAGSDDDGRLWLVAAWPFTDLFRDPAFGRHISRETSAKLDLTIFAEVATDSIERPYGGRCCTVDLFTFWPFKEWPEHGVSVAKAIRKLEAEWGLMEDGPVRNKWLYKPLRELVAPGAVGIQLYQFRMDEEGMGFEPGRSWPRHALKVLTLVLDTFIRRGGSFSPQQVTFGTMTYRGDFDFYDVANYFIEKGRQE